VDDTAQGSFGGLQVREADLARHLEEKKGAPAAAEAARDAASADAQTEPRAESPAPKRYEFGSQDDFQLQQAMKHLKGLPVETAKKPESVAASSRSSR
jgi:carboxyl-terminal processing protease